MIRSIIYKRNIFRPLYSTISFIHTTTSTSQPSTDNRRFPTKPIVAVSAIVLRKHPIHTTQYQVLLVKRKNEPAKDCWSPPGLS